MVAPQDIIDGLAHAIRSSDSVPDNINFITFEPDIESNPVKLPLVQVSGESKVTADRTNTNFVGFQEDDSGNDIGRIYKTLYTQEFEVASWTAQGSKYDVQDVSQSVRKSILPYTTAGPAQELIDSETGEKLDDVWNVKLLETQRTDDLGTSPTLRQRTEIIEVSASEQYVIDADEPPASGFDLDIS